MTDRTMTAGEAFYLNRLGNSNGCVPWLLLLPDIKEEFERDADRVLQNAAAIRERMGEGESSKLAAEIRPEPDGLADRGA